jgi:uncharacterized protein YqhQ
MKVGGQALADGVLMRTERAWAIARADGSVEVGALAPPRFGRVPGLRVLTGVVAGMRLALGRRGGRGGRRLLWALLVVEALVLGVGTRFGDAAESGWVALGFGAVTLVVLRALTPRVLWRYHGAEHKAVAAYEQGVELRDTQAVLACTRVHDRCGTNLVFLMLVGSVLLGGVSGWAQVPAFLASLVLSAEAVGLAASRPRALPSRLVLVGGRALQRLVTTAEPTPAEQAVACRALLAVLEEEWRARTRDVSSRAPVGAFAA